MADDQFNIALWFALCLDLTILFGVSLFGVQTLRPDHRTSVIAYRYVCTVGTIIVLGILLSLWSIVVVAKAMAGVTKYGALTSHISGVILTTTTVGLVWIARLVALVSYLVVVARLAKRPIPHFGSCAGLGAVALAIATWAGHGAMHDGATGYLHLASDIAHVLAAGAWVGALAAFVLLVSTRHAASTGAVEILGHTFNDFVHLGTLIVATLLATGVFNYWPAVGPVLDGLFSSLYGCLLLPKFTLFGAMLDLTAVNRYRLSPQLGTALDVGDHSDTIIALCRSLCMKAGPAVVILAAVAWLGALSLPGAQAILAV